MRSVATSLQITPRTLRNWFDAERRPTPAQTRRAQRTELVEDAQWLHEQYVTFGHSPTVIADTAHVSRQCVADALDRFGIDRPHPPAAHGVTADMIAKAIERGESQRALAEQLGVGRHVIRSVARDAGLSFRPNSNPTPPELNDHLWLVGQLVHQNRTIPHVAQLLRTSPSNVRRAQRRLGVTQGTMPSRLDRPSNAAHLRRRYIVDRARLDDIAAELNVSTSTVSRAVKRHGLTRTRLRAVEGRTSTASNHLSDLQGRQ